MPRGHPNYLYGLPPSNLRSYVRKKSVRSVTYKEPRHPRDRVTGRYKPQYTPRRRRPEPRPEPPPYYPRKEYDYDSE